MLLFSAINSKNYRKLHCFTLKNGFPHHFPSKNDVKERDNSFRAKSERKGRLRLLLKMARKGNVI